MPWALARRRVQVAGLILSGCAMLAASHWINLALHALALSPPDKDFQHPYFLTDDERGAYDQALGPELLRAYDEIENLRPFYVRGADAGGASAGRISASSSSSGSAVPKASAYRRRKAAEEVDAAAMGVAA